MPKGVGHQISHYEHPAPVRFDFGHVPAKSAGKCSARRHKRRTGLSSRGLPGPCQVDGCPRRVIEGAERAWWPDRRRLGPPQAPGLPARWCRGRGHDVQDGPRCAPDQLGRGRPGVVHLDVGVGLAARTSRDRRALPAGEPVPGLADASILGAAGASLIAVGLVLFGASHAPGALKYVEAGFAVLLVFIS